jgi:L-amino acid N-acyltransferase YncA
MKVRADLMNGSKNCSTQDQIIIRRAQPEDVQKIVHIYREGFESSWGHLPTRSAEEDFVMFQARVLAPLGNSCVWVAITDNCIVGWQALQDLGFVAQSSTYVDAEWHAVGVGRKLLSHAQSEAHSLGFTHVVGWIRKDNASSLGLVRSLGWQLLGCLPRSSIAKPDYVYYTCAVIDSERDE